MIFGRAPPMVESFPMQEHNAGDDQRENSSDDQLKSISTVSFKASPLVHVSTKVT